uniref:Uncharacterized protein n=1 Tax=Oryza sativa subsp. japonica TaxID=39947 RepID=Q6Z5X8_ORYSJ|nr:hypothetical protein [Oryza sativa Japonica Group]BAD01337.1 hypothetical protein [Oryza sativa Japonica Group]
MRPSSLADEGKKVVVARVPLLQAPGSLLADAATKIEGCGGSASLRVGGVSVGEEARAAAGRCDGGGGGADTREGR